jgi:hypothetical protein
VRRRKKMIADAIAQQAAEAIAGGSRFQVLQEHIGDEVDVRKLITKLAVACGYNVRANSSHGLLTLYGDNSDDGTIVTVATIEK